MTTTLGKVKNRLLAWTDEVRVRCGLLSEHEASFRRVYRTKAWGDDGRRFYSGTGSDADIVAPYIAAVSEYIAQHDIGSVLDIGCGDFRAGSRLELGEADYCGMDVVPELILHNQREFGSKSVRFVCANALTDPLPDADLCLLKHVLQHLSNDDVRRILSRLERYAHVLVMDGYDFTVDGERTVNEDVSAGGYRRDGLQLDAPPFGCETDELLVFRAERTGEEFRLVRLLRPGVPGDRSRHER